MFECQLVPGTYPDVAGNTDYLILLVKGAPSQGIVVLLALNFYRSSLRYDLTALLEAVW